jgi:RibD domain-containing protein
MFCFITRLFENKENSMGKVVIHATMSLDAYIAGPNDDMSWMWDYAGPNKTADEIVRTVGAIVSGGRLFRLIDKDIEKNLPYGGAVKMPVFVLTHHPREAVTRSGVTLSFHHRGLRKRGQAGKSGRRRQERYAVWRDYGSARSKDRTCR